jgi:spermidine synthase
MSMQRSTAVRVALVAFLLSGAAALIYEVAWTRALSLILGSTTYAVSTMLATFMSGLALGAWLGGRLADRKQHLLFLFGLCELGIGVTGLVSLPLLYALPRTYLGLYRSFHDLPTAFFVGQILLCALVMLVPTTLMGATFPLVSRAITGRLEEMGESVGSAYSFNTVGAVVGSLAAGFLLIPSLGLRGAVVTAALLNLVVGAAMAARFRSGRPALMAVLLAAYLPAGGWALAARQPPIPLNFYSAHRHLQSGPYEVLLAEHRQDLEPIFAGDYAEGRVTAFRSRRGHLLLQVGGKIEGTGQKDLHNTLLLAYLPIASHPNPQSLLVVGLGAGVTLAAARDHVEDVDLVEIHPGVLEAVSRFGPPGLLGGIRIVRNDARNYLFRSRETYDVISSEPSYPTEAGVANLFTREYFEIAAQRLANGGIYCQWLPYYMLTNADVTLMIKTFASVFPHTMLWKVPHALDLILVGSREPLAFTAAEIQERVKELNDSGEDLLYVLSRTPEQIAEIAAREDVPVNTDDRPILEFHAARNLVIGDLALIEQREAAGDVPIPEQGPGRQIAE